MIYSTPTNVIILASAILASKMSSQDTGINRRRRTDPPETSQSWVNILKSVLPRNEKPNNRAVSEQLQKSSFTLDMVSDSDKDNNSPKSKASSAKDSDSPKSNADSANDIDSPKSRNSDSTSPTGSDLFRLPMDLRKE